jgi:hypothetical protein
MSKLDFSKRLRFWVRITLFAGVVVAGLYFVFDLATPKPYKLLITTGLLGFLLYFLLGGGGGGKGDGWKNDGGFQGWWIAGD